MLKKYVNDNIMIFRPDRIEQNFEVQKGAHVLSLTAKINTKRKKKYDYGDDDHD